MNHHFWRIPTISLFALALLVGSVTIRHNRLSAQEPIHVLYLPFASKQSDSCYLSEAERKLAALFQSSPQQQRATPTCHPILAQVARARAMDMAQHNYFDHVNPNGDGPNELVKQAGYELPTYYSSGRRANNVESLAAGYQTAASVWEGWLASSAHRVHVLGEDDFYGDQVEFGVGHAFISTGNDYGHYWVLITAQPQSMVRAASSQQVAAMGIRVCTAVATEDDQFSCHE